jgi:hypothetical protein
MPQQFAAAAVALESAQPSHYVYVQVGFPVPTTAIPQGVQVGELLQIVSTTESGAPNVVNARLLSREPATEPGHELLQLRCVQRTSLALARVIASETPFVLTRVLSQPPDSLVAQPTEAPPLGK